MSYRALIIDLDRHAVETLRFILERNDVQPRAVYDPAELTALDIAGAYDIAFVDPCFPKTNGLDAPDYIRLNGPEIKIVALVDNLNPQTEQSFLRRGIADCLPKPYSSKLVETFLQQALAKNRVDQSGFAGMIGGSAVMRALYNVIQSVASTEASALISGETGTGKELVASAIHKLSGRRDMRFVTINCGALSESLLESELFGHAKGAFTGAFTSRAGKFEYANGGVIFLDEIGEISSAVQLKLLKVIETGELERLGSNRVIRTNTRMIFATNRDLALETKAGRFRRDLYYRINVFPIHTPPLRERKEDIPALANHFLRRLSLRHAKASRYFSPEAMDWLVNEKWEGNVRELINAVERGVIVSSGRVVQLADLGGASTGMATAAPEMLSGMTYRQMRGKVMDMYDKRYFTDLLTVCRGNISMAAKKAGLDRKTFYGRLSTAGIDPLRFRRSKDD